MAELKGHETETGRENRAVRERNARYAKEQEANIVESRKLLHEAQIIDLLAERLKRLQSETAMSANPDDKRRKEADFQLAAEVGGLKTAEFQYLRAEDFLRANKEQSDRARQDEEKLKAEAKARVDAGDITDAKARYAQASIHYDVRRPYASLCDVAAAENAAYHRDQDNLAKQAADEKDPVKRDLILLRKDIEHTDYMAITSERLAGISYVITGKRDQGSQFEQDSMAAKDWRGRGAALRAERRDLQKQADEHVYDEVRRQTKDLERGVYSRNVKNPGTRRENAGGERDRKEVVHGQPDYTQPGYASRPVFGRDLPASQQPAPRQHDPNKQQQDEAVRNDEGGKQERNQAKKEVSSATAERHAMLQARPSAANQRAADTGRSRGGMSR
jgi:hypothetical protein